MKTILIDAHNLMHQYPELRKKMKKDLNIARLSLVSMLGSYASRYRSWKFVAVMDGHKQGVSSAMKNVTVKWSGSDTADNMIKTIIDREHSTANILVVSSDHEVFNYARVCACQPMKSEDFAVELQAKPQATPREKPMTDSRDEIRQLMEMFDENLPQNDKPQAYEPVEDKLMRKMKRKLEQGGGKPNKLQGTVHEEKPGFSSKDDVREYKTMFDVDDGFDPDEFMKDLK